MTTNFLYTQAPNRKGNVSQMPPKDGVGVTAMTGSNKRGVAQPSGSQGAPKATGVVHGVCKCPVQVSKPKDSYGKNDSYLKGSSFLK